MTLTLTKKLRAEVWREIAKEYAARPTAGLCLAGKRLGANPYYGGDKFSDDLHHGPLGYEPGGRRDSYWWGHPSWLPTAEREEATNARVIAALWIALWLEDDQ